MIARLPKIHDLKLWPVYFGPVEREEKGFELRRDDGRGFRAGDYLRLREYDPIDAAYTGRVVYRRAPYLLAGDGQHGLAAGHVCMTLARDLGSDLLELASTDGPDGCSIRLTFASNGDVFLGRGCLSMETTRERDEQRQRVLRWAGLITKTGRHILGEELVWSPRGGSHPTTFCVPQALRAFPCRSCGGANFSA